MTNDEIKAQAIADVAGILERSVRLVSEIVSLEYSPLGGDSIRALVAQREQNIRLERENERLRKEAERIACDYWPGSPKELGLALDEMRGAIGSLAQVQAAPEKEE